VIVHGDSNLIHHIRTDATGGYLFVDTDVSYATSLDLGVLITTPALYGVTARDVSTVEADGIWDTAFSIVADDASHVRVSGYAEDSSLWVSGASDVDASELATWTTWIEMDGASTASLDVRERLSGTISGASTAYVFGQPLIVDAVVYDAASVILQ
jgi:hypothetical protein